jgi:hypothetical protein
MHVSVVGFKKVPKLLAFPAAAFQPLCDRSWTQTSPTPQKVVMVCVYWEPDRGTANTEEPEVCPGWGWREPPAHSHYFICI